MGHHAWAVYYVTRPFCCKGVMTQEKPTQPTILRVKSAEIFDKVSKKNPMQVPTLAVIPNDGKI